MGSRVGRSPHVGRRATGLPHRTKDTGWRGDSGDRAGRARAARGELGGVGARMGARGGAVARRGAQRRQPIVRESGAAARAHRPRADRSRGSASCPADCRRVVADVGPTGPGVVCVRADAQRQRCARFVAAVRGSCGNADDARGTSRARPRAHALGGRRPLAARRARTRGGGARAAGGWRSRGRASRSRRTRHRFNCAHRRALRGAVGVAASTDCGRGGAARRRRKAARRSEERLIGR